MPLSPNINSREFDKFRDGKDGTRVAVTLESDSLLSGVEYDDIQASFPNSTTEVYTYYMNTVSVAAIEVTYQAADKEVFLRARRISV